MRRGLTRLSMQVLGISLIAVGCKTRSTSGVQATDGQQQQQEVQEGPANQQNLKNPEFNQQVEQYCQQQLQEFEQDIEQKQQQYMNKHVQKFDIDGNPIDDSQVFFQEGKHFVKGPVHKRQNQQFLDHKHDVRAQNIACFQQQQAGQEGEPCDKQQAGQKAPIKANDNPALLVYNQDEMLNKISELDRYRSYRLPADKQPWSDDYWPHYSGVIGKRYASGFPKSEDWKQNYNGTWASPANQVFASGNVSAINKLSPAEKYDLVRGDMSLTTTKAVWAEGQKYYANSGKVETWMGICHGWAPAAYVLPRPAKPVTMNAGGKQVTFYPADIKSLGSYLWANANFTSRFMGGRCNDKNPRVDAVGRIVSENCFDNNPGSWHIAVINQLAVSNRAFVIDATYDYEVWNQPVMGYAYKYFNPKTKQFTDSVSSAAINKGSWNDPFRGYRSANAVKIVGVAMEVWYMVETTPMQTPSDGPENDKIRRVRYLYDIELDVAGKVIGGEWYQNEHPDFSWTPGPGSSQRVAETQLGKFVNALFQKSASGGGGTPPPPPGEEEEEVSQLDFHEFINSRFYAADGRNLWLNSGQQCTGKRLSGVRRCQWEMQNNVIRVRWDDGKVYWYKARNRNQICFAGEAQAPGDCQGNMRRQ